MSDAEDLLRLYESELRSADDLMAFAKRVGVGLSTRLNRVEAARMFPDKPPGYVRAAANVGHYCANLATALNNPHANVPVSSPGTSGNYADIAERVFNDLPDYAKRWIVQHIGMVGDYGLETPHNRRERDIERMKGMYEQ